MKSKNAKIIGLTGGVGSGKTTVSSYFAGRGFEVVDADKIAKAIVEAGSDVLEKLAGVFGDDILNGDGSLDRRKLAAKAFSDKALKNRMDGIMHGEILRIMKARIGELAESGYTGVIILDIPLLFEIKTGLEEDIEEIWVVDAEEEIRIKRVIERDGITRDEVLKIMDNQLSGAEKRKRAHIVIDNSGSSEELYLKLDELVKEYENK